MVTQTNNYNNPNLETSYVLRRMFSQITDMTRFEIIRNLKKTILILSIFVGIFAIIFAFNVYTFKYNFLTFSIPNNILPDKPGEYIQNSYLMVIGFMIFVLAILYGSSAIVEDFENQTGNLIFPNITKFRLLVARFTSGCVSGSISLILFYFLITLDAIYEYGLFHVPIELFYSLFWALLYYFTLLSLAILFSSFSKSTSIVIILLVLFVFVVSNILNIILALAGYNGEPFFVITYFGNIITEILNYPASRSVSQPLNYIHINLNGKELSFTQWLTPSPIEALIFMVGYSVIFLIVSYYFYERREVQ